MKILSEILSTGSALLVLLAPTAVHAQTITRITPEAASPGDLLILDGTGLAGTSAVDFHAIVGGFVGSWTLSVVPLSATATELRVIVPLFNNFIPPDIFTQSGDPFGHVGLDHGPVQLDFYFTEGTGGQLQTLGAGSSQPGGQGKPVISFTLSGGAPAPGQPPCTLRLENATAGAAALLLVGLPAIPPYTLFGDGALVVNVGATFLMFGPVPVNAAGDAELTLPMPAAAHGLTVAMQWGFKHPSTHAVTLSNGFRAKL